MALATFGNRHQTPLGSRDIQFLLDILDAN